MCVIVGVVFGVLGIIGIIAMSVLWYRELGERVPWQF